MKDAICKSEFIKKVQQLLDSTVDVDKVNSRLPELYSCVLKEIPLINPIAMSIVDSTKLYHYYYQINPDFGKAIEIVEGEQNTYLWMDDGSWCLDDQFRSSAKIAKSMANSSMFNCVPENIRELNLLLTEKHWRFSTEDLPIFGGVPPADAREVLSYDDNYILAGTNLDTLSVLSRKEWDDLCQRENTWFIE